MQPDNTVVQDRMPEGMMARALVDEGRAYAVYVNGSPKGSGCIELALALPQGAYRAEWVNTKTGNVDKAEEMEHDGGARQLVSPPYKDDIALCVVKNGRRVTPPCPNRHPAHA